MKALHPGVRLSSWLAALFVIQCLDGSSLPFFLLPFVFLGRSVWLRAMRLCWRTRWLLLTLFTVFSLGVPGEPLWQAGLAPSVEGLREAGTHLGRLLLVLCVVAALLETLPTADLLAALHCLLAPLRKAGCDSERFVVRLSLVLRYVEQWPKPRDWRVLLDAPQNPPSNEPIRLQMTPLRAGDRVFIFFLAVSAVVFCGWQISK